MGFEVAYLSELGKFDGLKSEVSDGYGSHALFYFVVSLDHYFYNSCRRSQEAIRGCARHEQGIIYENDKKQQDRTPLGND